jgi:hypothetical protein
MMIVIIIIIINIPQLPIRFHDVRGETLILTYHVRCEIPTPVTMRYNVFYEMSGVYSDKNLLPPSLW